MDYSPPGFSVHGILQARILEWIAISFSRGTSQQESNPGFLHGRQILYHLSYREVPYLGRGHPFNITVSQVCAPMSNAQETEVERFYEDLQDLLELTPQKEVLFIIGDWNAKVGSQETPRVTGKFGLGVQNEAGQRLIEFCQANILVIANTLFQQHKRRLYTLS